MNPKDMILAELRPLFERADREGLWFFCGYQSLWFSPAELREEHQRDSFIWGPTNWQLRDPKVLIDGAARDVATAQENLRRVTERVAKSKALAL